MSAEITLPPPNSPHSENWPPPASERQRLTDISGLDPSGISAVEYIDLLDGEIKGVNTDAGFRTKPKGSKPSEDTAYVHTNGVGETYIGIFDGMGGHSSGQLAAEIARQKLHEISTAKRKGQAGSRGFIEDTFDLAVSEMKNHPELGDGGTTGLIGVIQHEGERIFLRGGAVGDSLGFIVRSSGQVVSLNREETLARVHQDLGETYDPEGRSGTVITNALSPGVYRDSYERFDQEVFPGDVIVFTSDGITGDKPSQKLSGSGSNEEIIAQIALDRTLTPKQRADMLIERATKIDDRTAIIIDILPSSDDIKSTETTVPRAIGGLSLIAGGGTEINEQQELSRNEMLFAPLPDLEIVESGDGRDFALLLTGSDEDYDRMLAERDYKKTDHYADNLQKRAEVTLESIENAKTELSSLRMKDQVLNGIISEFEKRNGIMPTDELVKAIRTNGDFRLQVGSRIMEIVNKYEYSIRYNVPFKKTNYPGYEGMPDDMTSKEFVALLVLSMLDGTFKEDKSDPIVRGPYGEVTRGKHRSVALSILRNFRQLVEQ